MLFFLLAYVGGILTILSPCVLPVLPFVFARANRSFLRSSLPLLAGMAITFALVATLAAVGGGWAVQANQAGRWAALALLAFFGVTLLFPHLADRAMQPLVRLGARLSSAADRGEERIGSSLPPRSRSASTPIIWRGFPAPRPRGSSIGSPTGSARICRAAIRRCAKEKMGRWSSRSKARCRRSTGSSNG